MSSNLADTALRNQDLPLFEPRSTVFACTMEASKVPKIDAEADGWFIESRALESPQNLEDERDYKKIVQLTRMAAERYHWKAMLNLASLYLEGRDPERNSQDAVQLIEKAMELGIPAAYDRMGTYYINGTGVESDATRAYAFWQKAAQLGNPQALTTLAEKLNVGPDSEDGNHWSNIPTATRMLECALAQGYAPAAFKLHYLYASPRDGTGKIIGERNAETKSKALDALHRGVMLGCAECANALAVEFDDPFDIVTTIVPYVDKSRGKRYLLLSNELNFNPSARFPNLDKVVPLPPADLPPWNGDRDTLLAAAMGVTLPLTPAKTTMASAVTQATPLDPRYQLRFSGEQTVSEHAPLPGYWQPDPHHYDEAACRVLARTPPRAYLAGEAFAPLFAQDGDGDAKIDYILWRHFHTLRHNHGAVEPLAAAGLTREVSRPDNLLASNSDRPCPATGTWQPWVRADILCRRSSTSPGARPG